MLVVAGAGTGKTTVLTQRIARLLREGHAKPSEILAITYTKNSARDLVVRLAEAWLGRSGEQTVQRVVKSGIKVGTFHAYCYDLLRVAGQRFEIIDDQDMWVLLRRKIDELGLQYFITAGNLGKFLTDLLSFFRRCSDELRGPDDYDRYVAKLLSGEEPPPRVCSSKQELSDAEAIARCQEVARVFRHVEQMLTSGGLGTYGDLISRALALLEDRQHPQWAKQAREGAKFILIDEFQDSNAAQIKLAKRLAGQEANVFAVGDPDQAIYRFRGATSGAFDQFLAIFGPERVKRLTMSGNRRSTQAILSTAYQVIAKNPEISATVLPGGEHWLRKPLVHCRTTPEPSPAPMVRVRGCRGRESEAGYVVEQIERMNKRGRLWRDFAVLYRNNYHRDEVVQRLRERGIPFQIESVDLLETTAVRDLLAVLRAVQQHESVALVRVASLPQFQVDGTALRTVLANAGEDAAPEKLLADITGGAEVMSLVTETRKRIENASANAYEAVAIAERCFALKSDEDREGFAQFVRRWTKKPEAICGKGTLPELLDYLDLFTEAGGKVCRPDHDEQGTPENLQMEAGEGASSQELPNAVRLMTVHTAKGLEFPVVFVIRVSSNSFPGQYREDLVEFPVALRNRENIPEGDPKELHEEEERRLFYVSVTRAQDELVLCGKAGGKKNPAPAGYLRELADLKSGVLKGQLEFTELAEGTQLSAVGAGAYAQPRVHEWVALPPLDTSRVLRLSPSAIESYSYCPLRYKLSLDWNLPEEPAAAMQFGAAMHTALMGYFDAQRKGKTVDAEAVIASFMDEFAKAKIDEPLQRELYQQNGRCQLLAFLNSRASAPYGKVSLIEHRINFSIAGVQLVGRIDRVDEDADGLTIVDYKTGRPKTQETADKSLQLSIYALAMKDVGAVKAVIFENLEDGSTVSTTRDAGDLKKAETRIAEVAENIRAGNFDPDPGIQCSWCAYRILCPEQELVTIAPAEGAAPS